MTNVRDLVSFATRIWVSCVITGLTVFLCLLIHISGSQHSEDRQRLIDILDHIERQNIQGALDRQAMLNDLKSRHEDMKQRIFNLNKDIRKTNTLLIKITESMNTNDFDEKQELNYETSSNSSGSP